MLRLISTAQRQILLKRSHLFSFSNNCVNRLQKIAFCLYIIDNLRVASPAQSEDPATVNADIRRRICEDITTSDYFLAQGGQPVIMFEIFEELKQKKYRDIFNRIYKKSSTVDVLKSLWQSPNFMGTLSSQIRYRYTNEFTSKKFEISGFTRSRFRSSIPIEEHVFVCIIRKRSYPYVTNLCPYYVSREYNVFPKNLASSSIRPAYNPGRFIFKPHEGPVTDVIALAEEPSRVYISTDYNVEMHYLQIRRTYRQAESTDSDPVCQLIPNPEGLLTYYNQHDRLCVTALGSLYFKSKIKHPQKSYTEKQCYEQKISFQTAEAQREAVDKEFYEWMIFCEVENVSSGNHAGYFISRAYYSNQVFVYVDSLDGNVFLENFSTNISVVDDGSVSEH